MPNPLPGETEEDFLDRCIPVLIREGREASQAAAICVALHSAGGAGKAAQLNGGDTRFEYYRFWNRRRVAYEAHYTRRVYKVLQQELRKFRDVSMLNEFDKPFDTKPLEELCVELYVDVGDKYARSVFNALKATDFQLHYKAATPPWIQRMQQAAWLDNSSRIVNIGKDVQRAVNDIIVQGLEQGWTIDEIRDRITGVSGLPPLNGTLQQRAERIARTQTVSAANAGTMFGAEETGLPFKKEWLSARDGRTRRFANKDEFDHFNMDGVTVEKDELFKVPSSKGMPDEVRYPGDMYGAAANVINCRCALAIVTEDVEIKPPPIPKPPPQPKPQPRAVVNIPKLPVPSGNEVTNFKELVQYLKRKGIDASKLDPKNISDKSAVEMYRQVRWMQRHIGKLPATLKTVRSKNLKGAYGEAGPTTDWAPMVNGQSRYNLSGFVHLDDKTKWSEHVNKSSWNRGKSFMTTWLHEVLHQYDFEYSARKLGMVPGASSFSAREVNFWYKNLVQLSDELGATLKKEFGTKRGAVAWVRANLGDYAGNRWENNNDPAEILTLLFEVVYTDGFKNELVERLFKQAVNSIRIYK